jgi:RHS repeat-associated protein
MLAIQQSNQVSWVHQAGHEESVRDEQQWMRRYAGKWHRFVQPDPYDASYDLTNPQSFNRYAYVQNDPVNFVDPLGLDPPPEPWEVSMVEGFRYWGKFSKLCFPI